jgi:hypothetical protein
MSRPRTITESLKELRREPEPNDDLRILAYAVSGRIVEDTYVRQPNQRRPRQGTNKAFWTVAAKTWTALVKRQRARADTSNVEKKWFEQMIRCTPPGYPVTNGLVYACDHSAACLFCYARQVGGLFVSLAVAARSVPHSKLRLRRPHRGSISSVIARDRFLGAVVTRLSISRRDTCAVLELVPSRRPSPSPETIADQVVSAFCFPRAWCTFDQVGLRIRSAITDRVRAFERYGLCRSQNTAPTKSDHDNEANP